MIFKILGTDDEQQEYEYLGEWGPRFDKLADMYGPNEPRESEEEEWNLKKIMAQEQLPPVWSHLDRGHRPMFVQWLMN